LENGDPTEGMDKGRDVGCYPAPVGMKHGTCEHGQTDSGCVWCKCDINSASAEMVLLLSKLSGD
jgi:hypothetical protein